MTSVNRLIQRVITIPICSFYFVDFNFFNLFISILQVILHHTLQFLLLVTPYLSNLCLYVFFRCSAINYTITYLPFKMFSYEFNVHFLGTIMCKLLVYILNCIYIILHYKLKIQICKGYDEILVVHYFLLLHKDFSFSPSYLNNQRERKKRTRDSERHTERDRES